MGKKDFSLKIEIPTDEAECIFRTLKESGAPLDGEVIQAFQDFSSFDGGAKITLVRKDD